MSSFDKPRNREYTRNKFGDLPIHIAATVGVDVVAAVVAGVCCLGVLGIMRSICRPMGSGDGWFCTRRVKLDVCGGTTGV